MLAPRLGMGLAASLLLLPARACGEGKAPPGTSEPAAAFPVATPAAAATPQPGPDVFAGSVRPVLRNRCAPCHEPGGQMYAKLPFDDAAVVAAHPEGVLKRLKDADREAVEKWLAGLPDS